MPCVFVWIIIRGILVISIASNLLPTSASIFTHKRESSCTTAAYERTIRHKISLVHIQEVKELFHIKFRIIVHTCSCSYHHTSCVLDHATDKLKIFSYPKFVSITKFKLRMNSSQNSICLQSPRFQTMCFYIQNSCSLIFDDKKLCYISLLVQNLSCFVQNFMYK